MTIRVLRSMRASNRRRLAAIAVGLVRKRKQRTDFGDRKTQLPTVANEGEAANVGRFIAAPA